MTPEPEERALKEERLKSSQNNKYPNCLLKGTNDKVVKNLVKKMGAQQLGVDEINFFRDDNTVLHFVRPEGKYLLKDSLCINSKQYFYRFGGARDKDNQGFVARHHPTTWTKTT